VLEAFFDLLPRNTEAAARLARRHDERLIGRSAVETDAVRPVRHALEVRHSSFESEEFVALLRANDVALVVADTAGKWPFMEDVTSDFMYVRLHGAEELYVSGYTESALDEWTRKIRAWSAGKTPSGTRLIGGKPPKARRRDVFVYFDNDVKVRAPHDAISLAHRLGLCAPPEPPPSAAVTKEIARRNWPGVSKSRVRS
jgi:uncharacterized protein YecE (DUF72 family)